MAVAAKVENVAVSVDLGDGSNVFSRSVILEGKVVVMGGFHSMG